MIFWYTGNTGAGKTSAAKRMGRRIPNSILLDGDCCREVWKDLDLSDEGRTEQNLRVARLAKMLSDQGFTVLVAVICPFQKLRFKVKEICQCEFIYVEGGARSSVRTPYEIPHHTEYMEKLISLEKHIDN